METYYFRFFLAYPSKDSCTLDTAQAVTFLEVSRLHRTFLQVSYLLTGFRGGQGKVLQVVFPLSLLTLVTRIVRFNCPILFDDSSRKKEARPLWCNE